MRYLTKGRWSLVAAIVLASTAISIPAIAAGALDSGNAVVAKKKHTKKPVRRGPRGQRGLPGVAGSPGAQGQQGVQGPAGRDGAQGPSDIYADGFAFGSLTVAAATYATLSLPPGSYLIQGKALVGGDNDMSTCQIETVPHVGGDIARATFPGAGSKETLALSLVARVTVQTAVTLRCFSGAANPNITDARLTGISTATLHGTTPED